MAQILVGAFDDFAAAEAVAEALRSAGIGRGDIEVFHLNAAGQHGEFPIGGDEDADRGARKGDEGQLTGAAVGGALGLALGAAAIPVVGPIAAAAGLAVGAYTGSLHGAVNQLGDQPPEQEIPPRPAGVRVAVNVTAPADRDRTLDALKRRGALSIEEVEGTWRDGSWTDFDPVSTPRWIEEPRP